MTKIKKSKSKKTSAFYFALFGFATIAVVMVAFFLKNNLTSTDVLSAEKLNYQDQLSKKQCNTKSTNPVVNVTQKVVNTIDSGEAGNYWAFDNFSRRIQIWKQTNGTYCATVEYNGQFDAQEGERSPGNTGVLTGNEDGTMHGGYRAIISGVLKTNPTWQTKGSVGTTDYKCDLTGNCPGAVDWASRYFNTAATGYNFNMVWWGWTYSYKENTWINAVTGNSGDIL